jgi:hypothetical protein
MIQISDGPPRMKMHPRQTDSPSLEPRRGPQTEVDVDRFTPPNDKRLGHCTNESIALLHLPRWSIANTTPDY